MKLSLLPKMVEHIVWVPVISFCKIFLSCYVYDALLCRKTGQSHPPCRETFWITLLLSRNFSQQNGWVFHFSNCPTSSFHFLSHDTKIFFSFLFFSPLPVLLSYSLMTLWMTCRLWCQDEWHHCWESLEIRVKQFFA